MPTTYSDNIQIVGTQAYINDVVRVLDFIRRSAVAHHLIRAISIRSTGLNGSIRRLGPYPFITIEHDPNDFPEAEPLDRLDATARNAGPQGLGTGVGSSVRLPFTPSAIPEGPALRNRQCTLVHELTHALRQLQGLENRTPLGANFDNSEEFFAIMVENTFRSGLGCRCVPITTAISK